MSSVVYSPLCNTDKELYLAYLHVVNHYGADDDNVGGRDGSPGWQGRDCRRNNNGVCFGVDDAIFGLARRAGLIVDSSRDGGDVYIEGVVNSGVAGARSCGVESSGTSGSDVVGGVCDLRGCDVDDGVSSASIGVAHDSKVDGRSVERNEGSSSVNVVEGKWKRKNAARKERRRRQRVGNQEHEVRVDTRLKFPASEIGYFSSCDESVKADLRSSRAKMLIAQNEQRARRALADVDRMNMEKDTRVNEAKFELNRLTVDDKLRKISEARMGGSAQTVISSSITSSPPSLSSGSVSPNSSISVAEEMRLRNAVSSLTLEVEQLKKKQVNEVHDGTFVRREVRGTGVYRVHTEEDEFGYSQWD